MRVNTAGQALIEIVIVVAIFGIIALTFAQLNVDAFKGQNSVRLSNDFNSLTTLVRLTMDNGGACSQNFRNLTFPASPASVAINLTQLKFPNGTPFVTSGAVYSPGLTITKLQLTGFQTLTPGASYIAMIHIEGTKTGGTFIGSPLVSSDTPVSLQTTASGAGVMVTGCGSSSQTSGWTATLPAGQGYCINQYPSGWVKMPSGYIGPGRQCMAYVQSFAKTYRYNSAGCAYEPVDGWVYGCSGDDTVRCGYLCFN